MIHNLPKGINPVINLEKIITKLTQRVEVASQQVMKAQRNLNEVGMQFVNPSAKQLLLAARKASKIVMCWKGVRDRYARELQATKVELQEMSGEYSSFPERANQVFCEIVKGLRDQNGPFSVKKQQEILEYAQALERRIVTSVASLDGNYTLNQIGVMALYCALCAFAEVNDSYYSDFKWTEKALAKIQDSLGVEANQRSLPGWCDFRTFFLNLLAISSDQFEWMEYDILSSIEFNIFPPNFEMDEKQLTFAKTCLEASKEEQNTQRIKYWELEVIECQDKVAEIREMCNGFMDEIIDYRQKEWPITLPAHVLNMSGKVNLGCRTIKIEGMDDFFCEGMYFPLIASINQLGASDREIPLTPKESTKMSKIEVALKDALSRWQNPQPIDLEKVQKGELVFISSGWIGHTIEIVFYKGYIAICNTGDHSDIDGRIVAWKINNARVTPEILSNISNMKNKPADEAYKYLHHILIALLSGKKNDFCNRQELFPHEEQEVENCSWTAKLAATRFAFMALSCEESREMPYLDNAFKRYDTFVNYVAHSTYDNYRKSLQKFTPELQDQFLRAAQIIPNPRIMEAI